MRNERGLGTVAIIMICAFVAICAIPLVTIVIPNIMRAQQSADRALVESSLRTTVHGLDLYGQFHGKFPLVLEDMLTPPDGGAAYVSPETLEVPGHVYQYTSFDNRYELQLTPRSGEGPHYFADQSTVIRFSWNKPADAQSTVLYEAIPR